jgi:hypothetical protein
MHMSVTAERWLYARERPETICTAGFSTTSWHHIFSPSLAGEAFMPLEIIKAYRRLHADAEISLWPQSSVN